VKYKGLTLKWDTLIAEKANELARYLTGKSSSVNFSEPAPRLERRDSREIRDRILSLSQSETEKIGIQKSTLHYPRQRARNHQSFRIYSKVREKMTVHI